MDTIQKQKLAIIALVGMVVGMILESPALFVGDIILVGLVFAMIFVVVGWLFLRRKAA